MTTHTLGAGHSPKLPRVTASPIFRAWQEETGGDRNVFLNPLSEACSRTKERSGSIQLKEKRGDYAAKNRAPYFFAILRDLAGLCEKPQEGVEPADQGARWPA